MYKRSVSLKTFGAYWEKSYISLNLAIFFTFVNKLDLKLNRSFLGSITTAFLGLSIEMGAGINETFGGEIMGTGSR